MTETPIIVYDNDWHATVLLEPPSITSAGMEIKKGHFKGWRYYKIDKDQSEDE